MKYKNIPSAIHNFGASFTSLMNYVADGYVIDDLAQIHGQQIDIEINWVRGSFMPLSMVTDRIKMSIEAHCSWLEKHLASQNIERKAITDFRLKWPAGGRQFMVATDDRGKTYKIYVS